MKKTDLQPVKGARDFIPINFVKRQWIFDQMVSAAKSFGFEQYDSPVLESIETYKTKTSSELVDEQSYRFTDRGGRDITIRPEMTPVLSRMVAANENELTFPIKWFSIPVLWRYEKPQSGRLREHFQWNVDIIGPGVSPALQDADIIAVLCTFFQKIGLGADKIKVHLNDKQDLQRLISKQLSIEPSEQLALLKSIDKLSKIGAENTVLEITKNYPHTKNIKGFIEYLNSKESTEIDGNVAEIIDYLKSLGLDKYLQVDRKIVRGLDYYTSTVFEVFPTEVNSRAVAGGGRYNNLVGQFSSRNLPGVGFGMGDVVLANLIEKYNLYPANSTYNCKTLVAPLSIDAVAKSLEISNKIRSQNATLTVSLYPSISQLRDVLTYANKNNFDLLLIIGDKELSEDKYTLRDLKKNHQTTDRKAKILSRIKKLSRQK